MKKLRTNNIVLKAGGILLSLSILFSSFLWIAPLTVSAAEIEVSGGGAQANDSADSYYPLYESPEYVLGNIFFRTSGLTDPVAKQYTDEELGVIGTYYEPTAYIYFGSYHNSATGRDIPLVHRVLDADADNTGKGGAMFVLSEFASAYKTRFAYNGEINNEFFTNDNIYSYSVLGSSYVVSNYAGDYYKSKYQNFYANIPSPRDYVRKITKDDVYAEMQGLFGFYDDNLMSSYRWDINIDGSGDGLDAESAQYLTDATFFPLSAKEFNDYVSTVPFAPGVPVTYINSNEYATYWLRTGLEPTTVGGDEQYIGEHDENENGNNVGAVDGNGLIIALDSDTSAGVRYGFNIETEDIVFTQLLNGNIHRLSFIEPLYKDTDTPFEAELIDIKDGVVTVKYKNVILDGWHDRYFDESYYLSVMIKDEDGNVTHYGSVAQLSGNSDHDPTFISDREGVASFRLPDEYKYGDSVLVFWERKNEYMQEGISHISNMVDLGCIHILETEANCQEIATCAKCGEGYGEVDPNHHPLTNTREYFFDAKENVHWNVCPECNEKLNITNCSFGSSCSIPCVCGNTVADNSIHDFDENGVCTRNPGHFEIPEITLSGGGYPYRGSVDIQNEGQLISFAILQNSGAFVENGYPYDMSVSITADLDFSNIEGYIPIGTEEYPFYGGIYGQNHTIKRINHTSTSDGVGIVGAALILSVNNLTVEQCSFEGNDNVGVLLGKFVDGDRSIYSSKFERIDITGSVANATVEDGNEGILVGDPLGGANVGRVYTYNVINGDGEDLRFSSDDSLLSISESVYRHPEDENEFARTAEQYASGQVAHELNMRQFLGNDKEKGDPAPSHDEEKPRVGRVSYCDGDLAYYTNERLAVHLPMDRTIHEPTEFYEFIWDGSFAQASVYCAACRQDVLMNADVEMDYSYVPVRGDYTASFTIGDETYTESITIIGIHIEDMIGMTYIEKDFDGIYVYPDDMMNNHRLDDGSSAPAYREYEVYFIDAATGEKLAETYTDSQYGMWVEKVRALPALKAGTYDLLVIGKNDYEGQEYIYKGALVIKPVTVTVTPEDVYKYYDGNTEFDPVFTVDPEKYEYGIEIEYSSSDSSNVGDYVLDVTLKVINNEYKHSVTYVLSKDTVMGYIFPKFKAEVTNKNYPTKFTYGDTIPTPTEENFDVPEGATLTFEWFRIDDETKIRIYEMPKDAGDYILRVRVSHTENKVGNYVDIPVVISPKLLSFEIVAPEGKQPVVDEYNRAYYYLDMGEELVPEIRGLPDGETLESAGVEISIVQHDAVWSGSNLPAINNRYDFPTQPNMYNYQVWFNLRCSNENYSFDEDDGTVSAVVYVCIGGADAPTPVLSDDYIANGEAKEIGIVFSWDAPDVDDPSVASYYITIEREGEQIAYHTRNHSDFISDSLSLTQPISLAGDYSVEIVTRISGEVVDTQTISFSVSFDKGGELFDSIVEMGEYTVRVTSDGDVTKETDLVVKREIVMDLKELDYFLSDGEVEFDKTNVVMEAGKVILLGHELVDVKISVDTYSGRSAVVSIKVQDAEGNDVTHLYAVSSNANNSHGNGGLGVAHIYDSQCDATCNVYGCESTRSAAHTGGIATCTSLAICDECHMEYGSYDSRRHTCEHTHIIPNPDDLMTHLEVYSCCGLTREIKGHVQKSAATCTDRAVCAECGWKYGDVDPDNHTNEVFTYKISAEDPAMHVGTRNCCGAETVEEHTGGDASCSSLAKCELCAAQYGELDPDDHKGEIAYSPDTNDGNIHSAHCADCLLTWTEDHSGGEATCSTLAVCEKCNASYGELDFDDHESEETKYAVREENPSMHDLLHSCCDAYISKAYHSGGKASCASAALCEFCGEDYGAKDPANHASDKLKYAQHPTDVNSHIKYHECCDVQIGVEAHSGADTATCEHANICDICLIEYGEKLEHVYDNVCDFECNACLKQTRAQVFHTDENKDLQCDNCALAVDKMQIADGEGASTGIKLSGAAISGICTASAIVLGLGGFAIFWFAIKKKSLAMLLKLLVG